MAKQSADDDEANDRGVTKIWIHNSNHRNYHRVLGACSSTVEPTAHNGLVGGSNPSGRTTP